MHPFFLLRNQLPVLVFDPEIDCDVNDNSAVSDYLRFYKLDFEKNICSKHCVGKFYSTEFEIVAQYWLPNIKAPNGTVFFLHGYYDHVGLFSHLIKFLLEQGLAVVAYDQPGHGLSSGEQASINDFSEYAKILSDCFQRAVKMPRPWHGVAQSTGCAVYLRAFMQEKTVNPFEKTILIAPLIRPFKWQQWVWLYRAVSPFTKKVMRRFGKNSHDPIFLEFVCSHDPLQSKFLKIQWVTAMKKWLEAFPYLEAISINLLVIQGEADETVDWRYNLQQLASKIKGLSIYRLPSARHHLANEREDIRQQVFEKIKQFLVSP